MPRVGPEAKIQRALVKLLRADGWYVFVTHGNTYQAGLPDLYLTHKIYGIRWIDVKNPKRYKLTTAQKKVWPLLTEHGTGIWILTEATQEQIDLLFKPPNWEQFWKKKKQPKGIL